MTGRRVVDLFCGCGGLSLGLEQAGMNVVAGMDNWKPALDMYRRNLKHEAVTADLNNVASTVKEIERLRGDLIAGGPPCQDFSSAGVRDHSGKRADMTYRFADIVEQARPTTFIMENVDQIRSSRILKDVIDQLAGRGYGITAAILDASYCGVPQARRRFFLIGDLRIPHNHLLEDLREGLSETRTTMRDHFGDKLGIEHYYRHPRNYDRRGIYSLDEPSATIRGVNRPVPPGYRLHPRDARVTDLSSVRPLTTPERAQVQAFPETFVWEGTSSALEQMIGNAVPVGMARHVGRAVIAGAAREAGKDVESEAILLPATSLEKGRPAKEVYTPSSSGLEAGEKEGT